MDPQDYQYLQSDMNALEHLLARLHPDKAIESLKADSRFTVKFLLAITGFRGRRVMSECLHVEKPFLDQLDALDWKVIDQGQGFIPSDPAKSLRTSFLHSFQVRVSGIFPQRPQACGQWIHELCPSPPSH